MSGNDPSVPIARSAPGNTETGYSLLIPALEADGSIHFIPEDGLRHLVVPVRTVSHYHQAFPIGETLEQTINSIEREKITVMIHDMELVVTDARVIVHSPDPKNPGKMFVGQLWYPWVSGIGFRPKQSFLNDSTIDLEYREDFANGDHGMWWEHLRLQFTKDVHPGELAREIAHRLAAHHLAHDAPDRARESLERLSHADLLPDPAKGELSTYHPSAYVAYPGGVPYVEWEAPIIWEWTITTDAAPERAGTDEADKADPPRQVGEASNS